MRGVEEAPDWRRHIREGAERGMDSRRRPLLSRSCGGNDLPQRLRPPPYTTSMSTSAGRPKTSRLGTRYSTPETLTAQRLAALGPDARAYVISLYDQHPTVRFLA